MTLTMTIIYFSEKKGRNKGSKLGEEITVFGQNIYQWVKMVGDDHISLFPIWLPMTANYPRKYQIT